MKSTDISNNTLAASRVAWGDLAQAGKDWSPAQRRHLAGQAGLLLHTLWVGREDLLRLPPARWSIQPGPAGTARLWPDDRSRQTLPLRLTSAQVIEVLALWLTASTGLASRREQVAFARAFFQNEAMDRHAFRYALAQVAQAARHDAASLTRALYREHFQQRRQEGALAGWSIDPRQSLAQLQADILRIEQAPDTVWVKRRLPTRLFLATLYGRTVVIKRHDLRTRWEHVRYLLRASRARRSCAAAQTLRDLGLPTPEPLAYLEVSRSCSYIVTAWIPHVQTIRAWVRQQHKDWTASDWSRARRELLELYVTPYTHGFYHDDTKALNILIDTAAAPGRRLWWIDVEGVIPGARLSRYRVLRNLAQLNGSLRSWVPESERLAFLRGVGWFFPWLHHPRIATRLRAWTRRRLLREVKRLCGP